MSREITVRKPTQPGVAKRSDAEYVDITPTKPAKATRVAPSDIMKAPISTLSIDELRERMNSPANRPRKKFFGGHEYTTDYSLCHAEYRRQSELAAADHSLALMERRAKEKALKKAAAWDECSAVGAGARPEYRSAQEINNGGQ